MSEPIHILEDAFVKAYDELADKVFRHCYFRVFNRERAKDLMQESFMRAWKYLSEGHDVRNMKSFIYKIANNLIIDESRKKKELYLEELLHYSDNSNDSNQDQIREVESGVDEMDTISRVIDGKIAVVALQKLEQKYRDAILMRYIDDLTPEEIADVTHESADVISVRIHRGIKQLRAILTPPAP
ncbi:RNA polymerase sigma factor [Candidatus Uhrbacteria bacterium]|nr:RNA polymerase sigma factor [Candidatus Uhrbacteria bacterium]